MRIPAFLSLLSASALSVCLICGQAVAAEVHVLNWKGYGTDEPWAIQAFEQATGHQVVNDYFNSEQEMLTKLRTNPGVYDVVMINAAFTGQAIDEGLIQPIDVSAIANAADLAPDLAASPLLKRDDQTYGVPWVWGLTAIAVNDKAFPETPDSIEAMWDPAHAGKVVLRDDALEAVQFGAIATGQNINAIDDLDAVRAKLTSLMPQIRAFWSSENEWNQMVAAGQLDIGTYWSGSAARAKTNFDLPVTFVVPKEGAVGWVDGLSIPVDAKNLEGALAFIDYMIDPDFYVEWDTKVGAPVSANQKAVAGLPESAFNRAVMGDPKVAERIQFQEPVSDDDREAYLALWQELKVEVR
ncbi:MAG: extracellular solute-binding protein [Alphaproteobacteria bacterium]